MPCVATGSIYLVADLLSEPAGAGERVGAVNSRGPGVLQMVMLVAVVVALVVLVFFALGYALWPDVPVRTRATLWRCAC